MWQITGGLPPRLQWPWWNPMTAAVGSTAGTPQFHSPPPGAWPPLRRRGSQTEVQAPHTVGFGQTHPCRTWKPENIVGPEDTLWYLLHSHWQTQPRQHLVFCGSYNWNPSSPSQASEYWEISRGLVGPCVTREVQDPGALRRSCFHFPGQAGQVWADILGGAAGQPPASPKILEAIQWCIISLSLLPLARADVVCKWNSTETTDVLLSHRREILPAWLPWMSWVSMEERDATNGTISLASHRVQLTHSNVIWKLFPHIVAQLETGMKEGVPQSQDGSYQARKSVWKTIAF